MSYHRFPTRSSHGFPIRSPHGFRGSITVEEYKYYIPCNMTNILWSTSPSTPEYYASGVSAYDVAKFNIGDAVVESAWVVLKFDESMVAESKYGYENVVQCNLGGYLDYYCKAVQNNVYASTVYLYIYSKIKWFFILSDFDIENLTYNTRGTLVKSPIVDYNLSFDSFQNYSRAAIVECRSSIRTGYRYGISTSPPPVGTVYGAGFYFTTETGQNQAPRAVTLSDLNFFITTINSGLYRKRASLFT